MEHLKYRNTTLLIWLILGVFDLIFYLQSGYWFIMLLAGFMFGGAFVMIIDNSLFRIYEKHLKFYEDGFKMYDDICGYYRRHIENAKTKKAKRKKRKKG